MLKRTVYAVVVLAAVGLVALALRPRPLEVEVVTAGAAPLRLAVEEDGKTRVRERYTVAAPVAGTLSRVVLHPGDPVEAGTVIARLAPLPSPLLDARARGVAAEQLAAARAAEKQAEAAVGGAQSAAELAQRNLVRAQTLRKNGASTGQDLEQAEADARVKASELESAKFAQQVAAHAVTQAEAALSRFDSRSAATEEIQVTSPVRGRVLHVLRADSGPVTGGTSLVEVGDLGSLEVVVELLSQDAVSVRGGMSATLSRWGGTGELAARVRRVEPAAFTKTSALGVEEQRVNALLDLDEPASAAQLGDGFSVAVSILTWSTERALQVPTSALFRQGSGWAVFVVEDDRARARPVNVGHRSAEAAEVLSGLEEGASVIVHPPPAIHDRARVHATRVAAE